MRRAGRYLLLVVILAIAAGVGTIFYQQKAIQERSAPAQPEALPQDVNASASDWQWSQNDGDRPVVQVRARNFKQLADPPRFQLDHVQLKLYHKDGKVYDDVRSASAYLQINEGVLYSEGDVEIHMAQPSEHVLKVVSSGVTFETKSGRAYTSRPASFEFDHGEGRAVGATYDPQTRELHLHSGAELWWRGGMPPEKHMKVEAGEIFYQEDNSVVMLKPWSRFTRGTLKMDAGAAVVKLDKGEIRRVDAENAKGTDKYPNRQIDYAAERLEMQMGKGGLVEKMLGERNVRLSSISSAGRTMLTSDRVDMEFEAVKGESLLRKATGRGNSRVESQPAAQTAQARLLRSDVIEMTMRDGGQELERVETHSPGQIEFLPVGAAQRYRRMDGERIWIQYGPENKISSFHSVNVSTTTKTPKQPDALTWSDLIQARFEPKTGQLTELVQTGNFRYEEGQRKASSQKAVLEQSANRITLSGASRVWDPSGTTSADAIVLDQANGDMTAEGKVTSTRLPEQKKKTGSMLDPGEALQAQADLMTTKDRNQRIRYEGNARLWQGSNRLEAAWVDIDRKSKRVTAEGNVVTQFVDEPKPVFTLIRAPRMTYTDGDGLAYYQGGVKLDRPNLTVTSKDLRAWLSKEDAGSDSRVERAVADGAVIITQSAPNRTRKGTGEHAVYEVKDEKVTLEGGAPMLEDSLRGNTRGIKLTWFSGSDKLLVDGAAAEPAVSRINRRK